MLWFLVTAYLCAGHYAVGTSHGYDAANGLKNEGLLIAAIAVLTWPAAFFVNSKQ